MTREPNPVAVLSARLQRAWPCLGRQCAELSPYSCAVLAHELVAIERAQHRHAERCCSGVEGGYVRPKKGPVPDGCQPRHWVEHDSEAEEAAGLRIVKRLRKVWSRMSELFRHAHRYRGDYVEFLTGPGWREVAFALQVELQSDPRGAALKLRLPGESELTAV